MSKRKQPRALRRYVIKRHANGTITRKLVTFTKSTHAHRHPANN